ncbi:hypothetical protein SAMN04489760_111107, partial [Syntrophus gentianae]
RKITNLTPVLPTLGWGILTRPQVGDFQVAIRGSLYSINFSLLRSRDISSINFFCMRENSLSLSFANIKYSIIR